MIKVTLPPRGTDAWGSGEFEASRGTRKHKGKDFDCPPLAKVHSPVNGRVTKLGYPYGDDLTFRYVEITDAAGARHRLFYVNPVVDVGDVIAIETYVGDAQDIAGKYSTPDKVMKNHVHYEILVNNEPVNPEGY